MFVVLLELPLLQHAVCGGVYTYRRVVRRCCCYFMYTYCNSTTRVCRWIAAAAGCCCYIYMYKYVDPVVSSIERPDLDQVCAVFEKTDLRSTS